MNAGMFSSRIEKFFGAAVCALFVFVSCGQDVTEEAGVSDTLAAFRRENISSVEYGLFFDIPEDNSPVNGTADISFDFSGEGDIVLDFRPGRENVTSVSLNGKKAKAAVGNEHIVISGTKANPGRNTVSVAFVSQDQSLNRNSDYLYTLLVPDRARTVFPCFDQPDMKAVFRLSLELPESWKAIANGPIEKEKPVSGKRKRLQFGESGLLSTYLFAFCAGAFEEYTAPIGEMEVSALYRETDPLKVAQMPDIFREVGDALSFMENYTGIEYPFGKYGFAILPGFQFGGMEHPGAIFFTDRRMFLPEHPTTAERISRVELISHETAHMWFGDAVTMKWFNDVWIKEVFANHFAAEVSSERFGEVDSSVNDFTSFNVAAYAEDRTAGTVSLSQPLSNLQDAGLVYGNIVYDKAPIVMRMLSSLMGEDSFRDGLREYLSVYKYSNATWDDLIAILDKYSDEDLVCWSEAWVHSEGMPHIEARLEGRDLVITQEDPLGRGVVWPQKVDFTLMMGGRRLETITTWLNSSRQEVSLGRSFPEGTLVVPNLSSQGYGAFLLEEEDIPAFAGILTGLDKPSERVSLMATLYENALMERMDSRLLAETLFKAASVEKDPLVGSSAVSYLKSLALHGGMRGSEEVEKELYDLSVGAASSECRRSAFRALSAVFRSETVGNELFSVWEKGVPFHDVPLGERDLMTLSYELAVRFPEKYDTIRETQLGRLEDPDRKREYSFVIRAASPDKSDRDALMESFLQRENRTSEPWVNAALGYLNHTIWQEGAVEYIRPALEELPEIQRTGDIFFPKNWISSVLSQHDTDQAADEVRSFLEENPSYPPLIVSKILQSADLLLRE